MTTGSSTRRCSATTRTAASNAHPATRPSEQATGDASLPRHGLGLSDDGRVFFNSTEGLVDRDLNEKEDAYQWEPKGFDLGQGAPPCQRDGGCVELLSTGTSPFAVELLGISSDGTDAYFFTRDKLAEEDENGNTVKIYDARVVRRLPVRSAPPQCKASDECHGPGTPAPAPPQIKSFAPDPGRKPASVQARLRQEARRVREAHAQAPPPPAPASSQERPPREAASEERRNDPHEQGPRTATASLALALAAVLSLALAGPAQASQSIESFRTGAIENQQPLPEGLGEVVAEGFAQGAPSGNEFSVISRTGQVKTVEVSSSTTYIDSAVSKPRLSDIALGFYITVFGEVSGPATVIANHVDRPTAGGRSSRPVHLLHPRQPRSTGSGAERHLQRAPRASSATPTPSPSAPRRTSRWISAPPTRRPA